MSKKLNLVQQNRRRQKRGLSRRNGYIMSQMVSMMIIKSGGKISPYINRLSGGEDILLK